ncbi:uncharacterized protein BDV17DRAFT_251823 [Aspergillus undulatus]|uniref:uncharacterized protein n=1 Tax=Aspergillus undulatus TaxID=1810928 RepID=UPI003CCD3875
MWLFVVSRVITIPVAFMGTSFSRIRPGRGVRSISVLKKGSLPCSGRRRRWLTKRGSAFCLEVFRRDCSWRGRSTPFAPSGF